MKKFVTSIINIILDKKAEIVNISLILSIIYLIIRMIDNLYFAQSNLGDEWYFISDYLGYLSNGYYKSVLNGISIPFMLGANLFYYFTSDISISLRFTNTFIVILLFLYLLYRDGLISKENKSIFLFFLCLITGTAGGMFYGTNDSLYSASIIIIFCEIFLFYKNNGQNKILLILSFTICILSRPLWIINIPILFICCIFLSYFIFKINILILFKQILSPFFLSLLIALLFNYPRLLEINKFDYKDKSHSKYSLLSYSDKSGTYKTNDKDFNWLQWHYYSQVHANERPFGLFAPMVNWSDVRQFKDINGENSLPRTYTEYLFKYPIDVFKRVPISMIETFLLSIRYLGIILFILPFWIMKKYSDGIYDTYSLFFPILIFTTITAFAIIIPHTLETRWFSPLYIIALIFALDKNSYISFILNDKILLINVILMDIITVWALWKWKIFLHI